MTSNDRATVTVILTGGSARARTPPVVSTWVNGSGGGVTVVAAYGEDADAVRIIASAIDAALTDFVMVIDGRGDLAATAPSRFETLLASNPDLDILYCDEAQELDSGQLNIFAKPVFSPERLRCQFYFGSVVVYRTAVLRAIGGLRSELGGTALYDLALRASRMARDVVHSDEVLFLTERAPRLGAISEAEVQNTRRALEEHLAETGGGIVESIGLSGVHVTARPVQGEPLVSIVIPTRGLWTGERDERASYLLRAVRSIISKSTYRNLEFVIVYDSVAESSILDDLRNELGDSLTLVEWTKSFNFSDKINLGVIRSKGEYLLILNDDVEVITPGWIEPMLSLAQLPKAGMSGCMLYYEDETIQHAGHGYWRGDATHIGMFMPRGSAGPLRGYLVEREVRGVTAACALMPRGVYFEVGGMTSLLPGNFNDVDLCMKVTTAGHDIYWTPRAELYHYESKTRNASVRKYEVDVAWGRWGSRMHDPRYWPYPV